MEGVFMDAKKKIMKYIKPKLFNKAKKSIAKLESNGELQRAADEITSTNAKHLMNGKVILTDHYIFCKGTGYIFKYDEVMWVYKYRFTKTLFFIPIKVTDSLYLATKTQKPKAVVSMGKDKMDEIKDTILTIYSHNNNCLIGYTNENIAKYKTLSR